MAYAQALASGQLAPGGVVTEGSAGSTAISLATVAPAYGCKCHVVIPDDVAIEKVCFGFLYQCMKTTLCYNSMQFHIGSHSCTVSHPKNTVSNYRSPRSNS